MKSREFGLILSCLSTLACAAPRPAAQEARVESTRWQRTPVPGPLTRPGPTAPVLAEQTLPTGLRVLVVEHHRRPLVSVRLVLPRGALSDPAEEAGRTHLAVMLAGDFYEKSASGDELVEERSFRRKVVDAGGQSYFGVEADYSWIDIFGYAQDTRDYLRLLAGALRNPRHGEESFAERRNMLLDVLEDMESADPDVVSQLLAQAAFGWGHPYARPNIGTIASLTRLGLEDVVEQQRAVLSPGGATLLVVGDVEAQAVFRAARAEFGQWRAPQKLPARLPLVPTSARRADVGFVQRQPASTLLVCAGRPVPAGPVSDAELSVLAAVLGAGIESRLSAVLREQQGMTYDARLTLLRRKHARALLACSPLQAERAEDGVRHFRETLAAAATLPPTAEELQRAKGIRLGEVEAIGDDAAGLLGYWTEVVALGEVAVAPERRRAEVEAVTAERVQQLARTLLAPDALQWVMSGERAPAQRAVEANGLGALRPIVLRR